MTIELEHLLGIIHSYQQDQGIKAFFAEISGPGEISLQNYWSILKKYVGYDGPSISNI